MNYTQVIDLHPLQHLYQLQCIYANYACIIDVFPLSKLIQLNFLKFSNNKINSVETLKHHENFSEYDFSDQQVPTPDELKFYKKILKVHRSHKQIRNIMNDNKITKLRTSLTFKKNAVETIIDNYARKMNTQLELFAYFIQSSNTQLQ
ncbi:leucine-rich_repeat domain-containing protein [Hexamita inflata]|uniref:Leucine-rich repeat domain-containing protein n=1 Tax=Hexamita inflata TaxID=28002 RepID=A0AA86U791_9EUKA|nr:leucine-rich repeat domain-containing protein [Hexamita inflata]